MLIIQSAPETHISNSMCVSPCCSFCTHSLCTTFSIEIKHGKNESFDMTTNTIIYKCVSRTPVWISDSEMSNIEIQKNVYFCDNQNHSLSLYINWQNEILQSHASFCVNISRILKYLFMSKTCYRHFKELTTLHTPQLQKFLNCLAVNNIHWI